MWDLSLPEHRAHYRKERMAEAERWRLVKLVEAPPVYMPLLALAGRTLILIGQWLTALEREKGQHTPKASLNILNTAV